MRRPSICILATAVVVGIGLFVPILPAGGPSAAATGASRTDTTRVLVVSANVREGSRVRRPADLRDGDDRRSFARRVLSRGARVPDVVLLQEVLGSARRVVRALNQHPRARRAPARYVVAVPPSRRPGDGRCDGRRTQPHRVIRDSAVVVNQRTVRSVHRRGVVRTWGSWFGEPGCAEQPWALVTVRDGHKAPRRARVASVHAAPSGTALKSRAVVRTADTLLQLHRRTPSAPLALGGDLNLTRCQGPARRPETAACPVRAAHRYLLRHGFRDAVRSRHLHGADGVVGVRRRLDFLYTTAPARSSWFDRCYRAFDVATNPCRPHQVRFADRRAFHRCQHRVTIVGRPGGSCPASRGYHRYYSDHPIVRATLG